MSGLSKSLNLLILGALLFWACRSPKSATSESEIMQNSLSMERHDSKILAKDSVYIEHFRDSTKTDSFIRVMKTEVVHHYHTVFVSDSTAIQHDTLYIEKAKDEIVTKPTLLEIWRETIPLSLTLSIIFTLGILFFLLRKK